MSYSDIISKKAHQLVAKMDTRNPFEIAKELGVQIIMTDDLPNLKGMYFIMKRTRFICVNSKLDINTQNIVCAHELGHDQLHRDLARNGVLQEFMLYDMTTRPEYEANIFAASILLDEQQMLDLIYNYHYDAEQIACAMHSDINLVALKVAELTTKGHKFNHLESKANFLK